MSYCARNVSFACIRRCCQFPAMTQIAIAATAASVGRTRRSVRASAVDSGAESAARTGFRIEGSIPRLLHSPRGARRVKIVIIAGLVAVVASLFSALYYLYRDRGQGTRMVRALALRVGLSAALIAFLVLSYYMGWISPTGLR